MESEFDRDRIALATGDREATSEQILWGFKVLKKIVGADEVHKSEMAALRATMQQFGASPAMIQSIESFDEKSVRLEDLLAMESAGKGMKRLLYAAILVAWADGKYAADERAAVHQVASYYKISPSIVAAIEAIVLLEQQQAALRHALLAD